jgi:oligopeptide transport system substrate-binding protein
MKNVYALILLALCCVSCVSCGKRETLVEIGTREQIYHVSNGTEPSEIDPHTTTGMPENRIQIALFEGLVSKHPETLEIIPAVAERWSVSEDGLTYDFYIRESAKWSNGDPITANDFVQSWRRALLPKLANPYAGSFHPVLNAERFNKGEITDFNEVGAKAISERHFQVQLAYATPYFLQILDHHSTFPVHVPTIEKFGAIDERGTRWTKPENFVGNGAFVPVEWTLGKVFRVVKNPRYWDADKVRLNEIRFYPIDKNLVEERMFKAGQLHKTEFIPTDKIAVYQKAGSRDYRNYLYFGTYFYLFNVTKPPLDDPRVRKALAYSVDRDAITRHVVKGGQVPAFTLVPPDTLGYNAAEKMRYDLDRARELLAEAGYPNGKGFPKIELIYNTLEDHQKIAVAIQQMWKKNLNINISIQNQEWKVFLNNQDVLNYQISRRGWIGDYLDPFTFLELFASGAGNNNTGWSNAEYDRYLEQSKTAKSREERYDYFQKAEGILLDEAPFMPLYYYTTNYLLSSDVKGYYPNIMDYHPYKYIYLESDKARVDTND